MALGVGQNYPDQNFGKNDLWIYQILVVDETDEGLWISILAVHRHVDARMKRAGSPE